MGALGERLDAMRVTATTADGSLTAELGNHTDVRLSFAPGVYDRCGERWLETQLEELWTLLWSRRMAAYYQAVGDVLEEKVSGETRIRSPRDATFVARRDDLVAEGLSADGWVSLAARGMRDWEVRIAAGILDVLAEDEFVERVGEAAADLISDHRDKIRRLKAEVYG
jgi:hypothetical protein